MLAIVDTLMSAPVLCLVFGYVIGRVRRRTAENKNFGEAHVRQLLSKYCENGNAHVLNNVTLRLLEDGATTQIDHILITTKGIRDRIPSK